MDQSFSGISSGGNSYVDHICSIMGAQYIATSGNPGFADAFALIVWLVGFAFEAGGDFQLARFKSKIENKGKLLIPVSGIIPVIRIILATRPYGGLLDCFHWQVPVISRFSVRCL